MIRRQILCNSLIKTVTKVVSLNSAYISYIRKDKEGKCVRLKFQVQGYAFGKQFKKKSF